MAASKYNRKNLPLVIEKQEINEKDLSNSNSELSQEEKSIIVSSLILMKDEDSHKTGTHAKINRKKISTF